MQFLSQFVIVSKDVINIGYYSNGRVELGIGAGCTSKNM